MVTFGDVEVLLRRVGTDGDQSRLRSLLKQLDGRVDALGIGGLDLCRRVGERDYEFRSVRRLVEGLSTPVVDGGGLKQTLERRVFELAAPALGGAPRFRRAFMTSGADRLGMARAVAGVADEVVFGDLMLGLPFRSPIRGMRSLLWVTRILLPILRRLPVRMLYPGAEELELNHPKHDAQWAAADLIAGDFINIRRYMPADLTGKTILTNTTSQEDVEALRKRGVSRLITTTPRYQGRTFGTNVIEASLTAYAGKGRPLSNSEIGFLIDRLSVRPEVEWLAD